MQEDFHYYATYCAAYLAGYDHDDCLDICYSAQFVDMCSKTFLNGIKARTDAATTQLQLEMMDARTDILGLQDITRIWASFHFLPKDLYATRKWRTRRYMNKYRLICGPNSDLLVKTVELARGGTLQAVGIAMHVLADTWAHANFAGTPSLVINNTNGEFFEIMTDEQGKETERRIHFRHNPSAADDLQEGNYTNTLYQGNENSVMNLGHGRAGHLPDYSFMKYRYYPAWGEYGDIIKDNPSDYIHAFAQMVYALKYLKGDEDSFEKDRYSWDVIAPYRERIESILRKRQLNASADWKKLGEELSGKEIPDFDVNAYQLEYTLVNKEQKRDAFIGKFITAALAQKGMVSNEIFKSGNLLGGHVVELFRRGIFT
jgi:hypothetical protein